MSKHPANFQVFRHLSPTTTINVLSYDGHCRGGASGADLTALRDIVA
jgi:hypothetical protein